MPPTGELFRATISVEGAGGLNQNVLHFRDKTGGGDAADLLAVLEGVYWAEWRNLVNNTCVCIGLSAQQLTPVPLDPVSSVPLAANGAFVGTEINSQLAVIFTVRTGIASRRTRGRIYLGCGVTSNININTLLPAGRVNYLEFRDDLIDNFVGDSSLTSFNLGVYSRVVGGDGPSYNTDGFTPCTAIDVQNVLGAQRRRRLGRGA